MSIGFVLPPSKSQTMRALIFAFLAKGKTIIDNPLFSSDTHHLCQAIVNLGGKVTMFDKRIEIEGRGTSCFDADDIIFAGNSGIIYRFMSGVCALSSSPIVMTGDASIRNQRPITPLFSGLRQLGVEAYSLRKQGGAPIFIKGPLCSGKAVVDGSDSQTISSLLICCAMGKGPFEIQVQNPGELPWIDLTLSWLDRFHVSYERKGYEQFFLQGNTQLNSFTYEVPGDVSASLFLVAGALITGKEITIDNFDLSQGDKKCIDLLMERGAEIQYLGNTLVVKKSEPLMGGVVDINPFIDALPVLSVLACFAKEKTKIINGAIARTKECDRIKIMAISLAKMGAKVSEEEDGLTIYPSQLLGAKLDAYHDHRIAMALTIATLGQEKQNTIVGKECVEKSFPSFFEEIGRLS